MLMGALKPVTRNCWISLIALCLTAPHAMASNEATSGDEASYRNDDED